jgi:hypothetical protein
LKNKYSEQVVEVAGLSGYTTSINNKISKEIIKDKFKKVLISTIIHHVVNLP